MSELRISSGLIVAGSCALIAILGGCSGSEPFDATQQIGPDPVLPEPEQSLLPDLKIAEVVG